MINLIEITKELKIPCDSDVEISGLNTLKEANQNEISFLENKKYQNDLSLTNAAAVFVTDELKHLVPKDTIVLVTPEPYLSLAYASAFFAPKFVETHGSNPVIGENSTIMENISLGKNVIIGKNTTIMAGVVICDNVKIGDNCVIYPNVTIYRDCILGNDVMIHSGTVIGSDGFGFANTKDGKYVKIYQNGNVIIGNDVEIGANTTIDRAAFKSTIIEDGARIDNLVHIAHNCKIGKGSIVTAQCGFAGSTILNEYVIVGAQTGFAGHLEVAPFSTFSARSGVTKSITEPKKHWGGFPLFEHRTWLKLQGKISRLLK